MRAALRCAAEMVIFEAARAICNMREVSTRELTPAVTVLQLFLSSSKPVLRFAAVRTLNKVRGGQRCAACCGGRWKGALWLGRGVRAQRGGLSASSGCSQNVSLCACSHHFPACRPSMRNPSPLPPVPTPHPPTIDPFPNHHPPAPPPTPQVAMSHPMAVTNCNIDMETLIADQNRSIATLAITTLLKTGNEASIDRLLKQVLRGGRCRSGSSGVCECACVHL